MDKRTLVAIALSMGIWFGWQKLYLEPIQERAAIEAQKQSAQQTASRGETKADLDAKGVFPESERRKILKTQNEARSLAVESKFSTAVLSSEPNFVSSWRLKDFSENLAELEKNITTGVVTGFDSQLRLRLSDSTLSDQLNQNWASISREPNGIVVSKFETDSISATRRFIPDENGYGARVEWELRFLREVPKYAFVDLHGSPKRENDQEGSIFGQAPDKVHLTFRGHEDRVSQMADALTEPVEAPTGVKWLGLDTRYFVLALVPQNDGKDAGAQLVKDSVNGAPSARASLVFPTYGNKEVRFAAKVYFGPKNMEFLKGTDPVLVDAIDFGWTSFLAIPLLHALKWLFTYVQNYGVAIILLTFFIKMLLFPLTYKSMKSMAKMAKLQPQLNALREKYKDDKEKLNMEMMSFMKTHGYNPVGGCLPILLQMPIFFALYRVLFNSMELYQAPFLGWIQDLSSPDPWFVTPVLLTGLMYLQQKISPNTSADPTQQKMLQFMPIMFGVFMLLLPAGLNIYMVVNSAVSIAQQYYLNRKLGITPLKTAKS